jgi:sugar lactone lactonase YvrE
MQIEPASQGAHLELIADYACATGENPLWHPLEKRLYWCDIPNGRIFRYDPASGVHEPCYRQTHRRLHQSDGSLLAMDRSTVNLARRRDSRNVPGIEAGDSLDSTT